MNTQFLCIVWESASERSPVNFSCYLFMPWFSLLPFGVGWTWLLTTQMMTCHCQYMLTKRPWLLSWTHIFSVSLSLCGKADAMLWAAFWWSLCQKIEGDFQPRAGEEMRLQANNPWGTESCQQPVEWPWKWILSQLNLRMRLLPSWHLVREHEPESPAKPCPDSKPTGSVVNKCLLF